MIRHSPGYTRHLLTILCSQINRWVAMHELMPCRSPHKTPHTHNAEIHQAHAHTMQTGDIVCAGASYGRVRTLKDDLGRIVPSAGPSIAVQLVGFDSTPVVRVE